MLFIVIVTIQLLSAQCGAQRTHARRDPRNRQTDISNINDHLQLSDQIATLNATALFGQLPTQGYSQPHYSTSLRATPPEVAKYRNFGNYFQVIPSNTELTMLAPPVATAKRDLQRHSEYLTPFSFNHQVLHLSNEHPQEARTRRYTNSSDNAGLTNNDLKDSNGLNAGDKALLIGSAARRTQRVPQENVQNPQNQKEQPKLIKQTQSFHDIYMRFTNPQHRSFGHVEFQPQKRFEKRFESQNNNNGNRHRGEIVWADATGGYGEHHWDLTQGKLR
ncbi:uncharacterized protein LOC105210398 [Zeugodacus cucurbitae]|uniref:uncharacterized protein LOC105210398 n=1 Tax=Zeugodacus cucurbitae TaxID=28588 RepID=UPI000596900F|nr:uncharacterized protein LOC105210398 [Zeugodacus cucurbitae]